MGRWTSYTRNSGRAIRRTLWNSAMARAGRGIPEESAGALTLCSAAIRSSDPRIRSAPSEGMRKVAAKGISSHPLSLSLSLSQTALCIKAKHSCARRCNENPYYLHTFTPTKHAGMSLYRIRRYITWNVLHQKNSICTGMNANGNVSRQIWSVCIGILHIFISWIL